jgi:metallophosphoesterase (TIGR00282 family)
MRGERSCKTVNVGPSLHFMNILFIGDVVGRPGRKAVRECVPRIVERHGVDMVIANGENSAGGAGITPATARELYEAGVHVITTGDHLWDQREVIGLLEKEPFFVRPLNYPAGTPGKGWTIWQNENGPKVAVMNLQGRTFMPDLDNPFHAVETVLEEIRELTPIIVLDFHAEATSEKIAMGRFLDGRVSMVVGTHTHVPTADEQIFPGGTAFLCDAGFTGPQASVLGREIDPVIKRFLTHQPQRFGVAQEDVMLRGVLIKVDIPTGRALAIERVAESL